VKADQGNSQWPNQIVDLVHQKVCSIKGVLKE
jgi:hypothetical protein